MTQEKVLPEELVGSVACTGRHVSFWNPQDQSELKDFELPLPSRARDIIRVSETVVGTSPDQSPYQCLFWDVHTHEVTKTFKGHNTTTRHLRRLPGRSSDEAFTHRLLTGGNDDKVRIWHPETTREVACIMDPGNRIYSLEFEPVHHHIWESGSGNCNVNVWDPERPDMRVAQIAAVGSTEVNSLEFDPVHELFFAGGCSSKVRIYGRDTYSMIGELQCADYTLAMHNLPEHNLLLVAVSNGHIREYDLRIIKEKRSGSAFPKQIPVRDFKVFDKEWHWRIQPLTSEEDMFLSCSENGFVGKWHLDGSEGSRKIWKVNQGNIQSLVYMMPDVESGGDGFAAWFGRMMSEQELEERVGFVLTCEVSETGNPIADVQVEVGGGSGGATTTFRCSGALLSAAAIDGLLPKIEEVVDSDAEEEEEEEEEGEGVVAAVSKKKKKTKMKRIIRVEEDPTGIDEEDLWKILVGAQTAIAEENIPAYFRLFVALGMRRHALVLCRKVDRMSEESLTRLCRRLAETDLSDALVVTCLNALKQKEGYVAPDDVAERLQKHSSVPIADHPLFAEAVPEAKSTKTRFDFRVLAKKTFGVLLEEARKGSSGDVVLTTIDGTRQKAHLCVLLFRSSFFFHMLHFSQRVEPEIEIKGVTGPALSAFLSAAYVGSVGDVDSLVPLLQAYQHANMYSDVMIKRVLFRRILAVGKDKATVVAAMKACSDLLADEVAFGPVVRIWKARRYVVGNV